jgi:hypothetical protein
MLFFSGVGTPLFLVTAALVDDSVLRLLPPRAHLSVFNKG